MDVPELFPNLPVVVMQLLLAALCFLGMLVMRLIADAVAPGAGPFAPIAPMVVAATLFGRWFSGVACLTASLIYVLYFVIPHSGPFTFDDPGDKARSIVNIAANLFLILLSEIFRRAVRQALSDRELLLKEIEHRVKNNFATVTSLLRLQIRRSTDEPVKLALTEAVTRIDSFSLANASLYRGSRYTGQIDMSDYLKELCQRLEESLSSDGSVKIVCEATTSQLPTDRAIILGLLTNEIVTNSFKHAFAGKSAGLIEVNLRTDTAGLSLDIKDDGVGMPANREGKSLGTTLISALAKQADGTMELISGSSGTAYRFTFIA